MPAAPEVAQQKTTQVLVANQEIRAGQRLSAASMAWQDWPQGGLRPDFVTPADTPDAITEMSGSVALSEFLPGDPIRTAKLAETAGSLLPTLLDGGMRGVSVAVTAESASGGFVSPNDHVDVVLTRTLSQGGIQGVAHRSETILHNVRVLAINSRTAASGSSGANKGTDNASTENFVGPAIATLALDQTGAEIAISASAMGQLSLMLRSAADFTENDTRPLDAANQAIRISSPFWTN